MAAAPELAPFAYRIVLKQLLIPLTALVAYLFGWGLCQGVDAFVRAAFGTAEGAVGWIPVVGRLAERSTHYIEHKITSLVGGWASHFENQFFTRWHALGQVLRQLAADTEAAAVFDWRLAQRLSHKVTQWQVTQLLKGYHAVGKIVVQRTTVVERRVIRVEKVVTHAAPLTVARNVGALAGEIEHVIEWDIPRLRARTKALEERVGRIARGAFHEITRLRTLAFAGAVAWALTHLGLGCLLSRNGKTLGKRLCRFDSGLLDALLIGGTVVAGPVSIVALAKACQEITGACEDGIRYFVREVQ